MSSRTTQRQDDAASAAAAVLTAEPVLMAVPSHAAILGLQRSAGNHAVTRMLTGRRLARYQDGAVAQMFDFDDLATRVHTAMSGLGTDEEAVYQVLQRLQRNPTALARLEAAYLARFNTALEADIRDDFSGTELEYALQLLGRGTAGSAQAVGAAAPATASELDAAAQRIRTAVEGGGTDEEAIYAVLQPLRRNTGLVAQLAAAYQALYGEGLRDRLVAEMEGSELDNALYLLGEATGETSEVSPAEAQRLFTALSNATFTTATGAEAPIPFHYPADGCYARAHLMAELLTAAGFASERVFAISTYSEGLHVPTDFGDDVAAGTQPSVTWWYHVAPIINVREAGNVVRTVIDPSIAPGPITIGQWTGMMSGRTFTELTVAQVQAHLAANGDYTPDQATTFTGDRNTFGPSGPFDSPDSTAADAQMEGVRPRISDYAAEAPLHEVASVIRGELRKAAADVPAIVAAIGRVPPAARAQMWTVFPQLQAELQGRLSPAEMAQVNAALGP